MNTVGWRKIDAAARPLPGDALALQVSSPAPTTISLID